MNAVMEQTRKHHASLQEMLADVFRTAATAGRSLMPQMAATGYARGVDDLTPLEVATEAVNLRRLAMRAAGFLGQRYLIAAYEYPVDDLMRDREEYATLQVASYCISHKPQLRDRYLVADLVRDYVGKARKGGHQIIRGKAVANHTDEWWSAHNHITTRTISNWKVAVQTQLQPLEFQVLARVDIAFADRGIEWRVD